jgi:hypothetical protein
MIYFIRNFVKCVFLKIVNPQYLCKKFRRAPFLLAACSKGGKKHKISDRINGIKGIYKEPAEDLTFELYARSLIAQVAAFGTS